MTHRIVVLGAGYAGLGAAGRAARLLGDRARVTLVNAADHFVERVRLHQLAAGQALPAPPLADLLEGTGVELVVARATGIDLDAKVLRVDAAPGALPYDVLVYAPGSGAELDTVPGVREHALTVAQADDARRLRSLLPELSSVTVVGGGLTGLETAAELAAAHPRLRVELVTAGRIGAGLSGRARRHLHDAFGRLAVRVREHSPVAEVGDGGLLLADGRRAPADAVVWTAGFRVPDLAAASGLAVDGTGRVAVDATLRSVSHPDVLAVGDAADVGGRSRMSCQTALPMGRYAGRAVADLLAGRTPRPHRVRYLWTNISLGRHDGVTQFARADDAPLPAVLTGRASALFKEAVTRGTVVRLRHPGRR
ncbi:FAD-dependent oxidoreductase [Actinomadura kijaniata]|uniref:NADH dehydrogenase FAD-containing subunit n=1 Tax=Actinomadura namibiensis TaxID=182080 RepID=A0A7W3LN17_ACTNM|nr:FAD-dependent oxidoreductase [Actinomadura namibiensis]MBA8951155.1 NADH dehydrogenase FAD-containing subunit [Actinomadura namibiensis]